MGTNNYRVDREVSARKRKELQGYFQDNVWNSEDVFICRSQQMCRTSAMKNPQTAFCGGQGQSVGPSYEVYHDSTPLRVLVIPMESGAESQGVSWAERSEEVAGAGRKPFRQLNPHMRGVLFTLQLAFGLPVGEAGATHLPISADGNNPHLFESFAMVNLLWCSAVKKGSMSSRSTGMMRASCARHMRATVGILKPNLVISQGSRLDETLRSSLGVTEPVDEAIARCDLDGQSFVWASLRHPTRSWHSTKLPYFDEVVRPTLALARELALDG